MTTAKFLLFFLGLTAGLSFTPKAWALDCQLWEDRQRITHIKAGDELASTYCFGYIHARDRAWQLDYFRRTAMGRNAEVYGFASLKGDLLMRLLDLPSWAEKLWQNLHERERVWLLTYAEGVNHGFKEARKKPTKEFTEGYPQALEKWKPQHSLMVLLLQSFDQTRKSFYTEWEEAKAHEKWGARTSDLFNSDDVPWETTVLKPGEYPLALQARPATGQVTEGLSNMWASFPTPFGVESGSNNWVVGPAHSRSGRAIFANDPHLDLKTPMFWYWVHVEAPEMDVIGASLPGIPMIVSGTNRHVSWGLTNAYINTADAARISEVEAEQLESFRPTVWVKWGPFKLPFFFKSFEKTKEGYPVLPLETTDPRPLVLKWTGFHLKGADVGSLRDLMKSQSAEDTEHVLAGVGVPAWNFVFADTKGGIGHRVVGKALRATAAYPIGPQVEALEKIRNPEFLQPSEMPHVLNPARGWIATANNRHWPKDAAFFGGRSYTPGFRAIRIEELLAQQPKHDRESFLKIQCDTTAVDARYMVPLLVDALTEVDWKVSHRAWLEKLREWDFSTGPECEVCAIYRRTMDLSMEALKVGEPGFWKLGQEKNPDWERAVEDAFKQAWQELDGKKWGEVHKNHFHHLSGNKDWVFSPTIPTKGDKHSVNPGWSKWDEESKTFDHYSGASERLIVEMFDTPQVWLILPGLNNRYDSWGKLNPWQDWADCQQTRVEWPVNWSGKQTEKVESGK